jgi:hypothetical protein
MATKARTSKLFIVLSEERVGFNASREVVAMKGGAV